MAGRPIHIEIFNMQVPTHFEVFERQTMCLLCLLGVA